MSPEEVPAELVEKATRAVADELPACAMCGENGPPRCVYCKDEAERYARHALAAVLPLAQGEAWVEGRDDGLDDLGATQTAIDYGELTNPYEEGSPS
jgi:hypothetical protein